MIPMPDPVEALMKILKRWSDAGKAKPKMFPGTVQAAAEYWVSRQEPPIDYKEDMVKITDPRGVHIGWETPYADRVCRTLKKFLRQKHIHQLFIIEAIERGIPWRGDDMRMFTEIVKEADQMLADPDAYKAKHSALMQKMGGRA